MNHNLPQPTEPQHDQPPAPNTDNQANFLDHFRGKTPALLGVTLGVMTAGARAASPDVASASLSAEAAAVKTVSPPAIKDSETLSQAKHDLVKKHLKYAGETDGLHVHNAGDKKHKLTTPAGFHLELDGWAKKVIKAKRHGKPQVSYQELKPNQKVKSHSSLFAFLKPVADQKPDTGNNNGEQQTNNDQNNNQNNTPDQNTNQNPDQNPNQNPPQPPKPPQQPPQPPQQPPQPPQQPPQPPQPPKPPIKIDEAAERTKYIHEHAVILPFWAGGCSGWRMTDGKGTDMIVTAGHCDEGFARSVDPTTGQLTMTLYQPLDVKQPDFKDGFDDVQHLVTVGTPVKQAILPKVDNEFNDTALLIMSGTAASAVNLYNSSLTTSTQLADIIKSGKTLYAGGFPAYYAPGSTYGYQDQEEILELQPVGIATTYFHTADGGKQVSSLWTANKVNSDGYIDAPGESGAVALDAQKVTDASGNESMKYTLIGENEASDDFRPLSENIFGVDGPTIEQLREDSSGLTFPAGTDDAGYVDKNAIDLANYDVVNLKTYATTSTGLAQTNRTTEQTQTNFVRPKPDTSNIDKEPVAEP